MSCEGTGPGHRGQSWDRHVGQCDSERVINPTYSASGGSPGGWKQTAISGWMGEKGLFQERTPELSPEACEGAVSRRSPGHGQRSSWNGNAAAVESVRSRWEGKA